MCGTSGISGFVCIMVVVLYYRDVMENECIFKFKYEEECPESERLSQNQGPARIHSIITASKLYQDGLHEKLENGLSSNPSLRVSY